jgi:hypothetical protein
MALNIAVLSNSDIKRKAIEQTLDLQKYNIFYFDIKDNPNRETQPLFINGTKHACNLRFDEFKKYNNIKYDIVISIENGMTTIDNENMRDYSNMNWCDFCVIGIMMTNSNIAYHLSPLMINIEKEYTKNYFEKYYKNNNDIDTFGKYMSEIKNIPHNNWMKYMYNIDRTEQIIRGLKKLNL